MFLCDRCHNPDKCFSFMPSYGPCECCGVTRETLDCHAHANAPCDVKCQHDSKPGPKPVKPKLEMIEGGKDK